MAEVLAPHGIKGELKCRVVTDFPKRRFRRGTRLFVRGEPLTIRSARLQGGVVLLGFDEVPDRTAAERLRGASVEVPREDALKLPRGQFYWHQVIGLRVEDATSGELLGTVKDIIETGANDVYLVESQQGELLVPAIKDVVKQIDPAAGRMLIAPLPGMRR